MTCPYHIQTCNIGVEFTDGDEFQEFCELEDEKSFVLYVCDKG